MKTDPVHDDPAILRNETVELLTDGEWVLRQAAIDPSPSYYSHYITHACPEVIERYKSGKSGWPRQRYFYHDDTHWECDLCHKSCPDGMQALLVMRMMDAPEQPHSTTWTSAPGGTFPLHTANPRQNTPK
jgi:hypothetical protein